MVHTTGGSEKTDAEENTRERDLGVGVACGQGQSLWIDLCVPMCRARRPVRVVHGLSVQFSFYLSIYLPPGV